MYDTYSLYSNYEYNLMCYLYTSVLHHCTDWILLDPVHANVASFLRTRINVVKGRIAWYVAALHHTQSRIISFTKDPKRRRFCWIFRSKIFRDALAMISVRRRASLCYGHQASARDLAKSDVQHKFQPSSQRTAVFHALNLEISA